MNHKGILFIIFMLTAVYYCFADDEPYILDRIVITANQDLSAHLLRGNYSAEVLTQKDLKERLLSTISEVLEYASSLDLRYRGQFGVQADLSLRGSTYEQVALLIDGVRINDPQTGHHNLDIPLTVFDIERVEIIKEGVSSVYGAGAFSGIINIITKKPARKALNTQVLFGEHALSGQTMSFSFPAEVFSTRLSMEHKISNGGRPNTDFEYGTTSFYLGREDDLCALDALVGYQEKDFGADSFYSNLFPQEEEHTKTLFFRGGLDSRSLFGEPKLNVFLRRHNDKFILDRNNPVFVTYHTTYVYGLNSQIDLPVSGGDFLLGFDVSEDEINSTRLGKNNRLNLAPSLAFIPRIGNKLTGDFRLRFDYCQDWPWQESYNVALGYKINKKLKLRGSFGHAFRIPSFTELYYFDPGNRGNPDLGIEESDNFNLGFDFKGEFIDSALGGFYRKGRNLIDWTRISPSEPWQATNLGRADFKGADLRLKLSLNEPWKGLDLPQARFSYTYIDVDKETSGFFSKYALDVLKHQLILGLDYKFLGLNTNLELSYNERYYGETYFLTNLYISKSITKRGYSLEPFLKIDNLTNTKYSEIGGVLQPGRWIQAGLSLEW